MNQYQTQKSLLETLQELEPIAEELPECDKLPAEDVEF
jgi:hypothetical protein